MTTAAVSARRIRGPNRTGRHPRSTAARTSSAVNPPSGPTNTPTE